MVELFQIAVPDLLLVAAISIVIACFTETIGWVFIYRTKRWKELKRDSDDKYRRLLAIQETGATTQQLKKKEQQVKDSLKENQGKLNTVRMISGVIISLTMFLPIRFMGKFFAGNVVARLPFTPFPLLAKLTHRGIEGDDLYDCGFMAIYSLCNVVFRSNMQKVLGHTMPNVPMFEGMFKRHRSQSNKQRRRLRPERSSLSA